MWRSEVLSARAFRLALAFALAVAVAMAGAFALIYFQVSRLDTSRVSAILTNEARLNVEAGEDALRQALASRLMRDIRRVDYLGLFDADGARVLGNISRIPPIPIDGFPHFAAPDTFVAANPSAQQALIVARRRPDGGVLVLGRDLSEVHELENTLLQVMALALTPTIALVLGIGGFFAHRASRRLRLVQGTIGAIIGGDLNCRLPISRENDEIDRVASAVNLMLDEIARLLDQLKSVGDNIAHDLRTPLTVARAKLERALNASPDASDAVRAQLNAALDQLDKAAVTISALLRISAVENGARDKRFAEVDLAVVCEQAFEFYEPLAQAKSLTMTASCSRPALMRGDVDLVREAISNLVDNAIKFTPPGGAVHIAAGSIEGQPYAEVSDTGPGVPLAEREKIFRRFYRAASERGESGHGLGLSIAEAIARLHGFGLTVEDNHPGARFVLRDAGEASLAIGQTLSAAPGDDNAARRRRALHKFRRPASTRIQNII
jgi:signal transduction histidine kinase